jgi:tetratricopeptide (TPR) repeat protein
MKDTSMRLETARGARLPTLSFVVTLALLSSALFAVEARAQDAATSETVTADILSNLPAHLTQADADRLFKSANDACLHEKTDECVSGYHRLLSAGFAGADLYFNLGTVLLRQNRLGPAILYLERAVRAAPNDTEVAANLAQAQRMRLDKLVDAPEAAAGGSGPLANFVAQNTQADIWTMAFLILWMLGWALLLLRRLAGRRAWLSIVGIALLALSLLSGAILASHIYADRHGQEAIVLAAVLPVREGPNAQFKVEFEIHEGLKVQIIEREASFQRIRLLNGLQGWVPAHGLAEVSGDTPVAL